MELNVNSVWIAYTALITVLGLKQGGKLLKIKGFEEKHFYNMGIIVEKQFKSSFV